MKLNRNQIEFADLHDPRDKAYWHSKTPSERMHALEINRRAAFGQDYAARGLQRVLEIVERKPR